MCQDGLASRAGMTFGSIEQGKILLNLKETILSSAITIFKYNLLRSIFAVITGTLNGARVPVWEHGFGGTVKPLMESITTTSIRRLYNLTVPSLNTSSL
ncbi:hypothetical protein [Wolbachia endosymbiont of Drosophila tsacasi]|uniref:hypothetical protein n=1 Tax=Wolbachia endosymbiont of Drosophila tsacasi TaxID=3002579 RepID=UPI0023A9370A|nr:hypothetical protein [Wolbachia endosymbiont of Drosophila tsacasi]MDE5062271.1 hypothetical protein [Wolbachia endosymbiont of Drosophila tsacasi]